MPLDQKGIAETDVELIATPHRIVAMRTCLTWASLALILSVSGLSQAAVAGDASSTNTDPQGLERGPLVTVTGYIRPPHGCRPAELFITARIKPGYWIYSITQASGGPNRTIIELEESSAYHLLGSFSAIQQPLREKTEWPEWPILEKHPGCVTWHAAIEARPGVDLAKLTITGAVRAQVDTDTSCLAPTAYPFIATCVPPDRCKVRSLLGIFGCRRGCGL